MCKMLSQRLWPFFALILAVVYFLPAPKGEYNEIPIIHINFEGIECTKFTVFQSPAPSTEVDLETFNVIKDDLRGVIVSNHGSYQYRFFDITDGASHPMYYRTLNVGSWAASDDVPTPSDGAWVEFSNLLIGRTARCQEPESLAKEQELYRQLQLKE